MTNPKEIEEATKTSDVCKGCGACCAPGILGQGTAAYLEITPQDLKADFTSKSKLTAKDQFFGEGAKLFLPVIRGENDFTQCEHLRGTVMEDAYCGCYASRPTACRIFEPGGFQCQKVRQAWLIHEDRVRWELKANPSLSNSEAAYNVVARHNCVTEHADNHVVESLGKGPDYVHLRKMRDRALADAVKKDEAVGAIISGGESTAKELVKPRKKQRR